MWNMAHAREDCADRLKILLDKDACLPKMPVVMDEDHWVKKPSGVGIFSLL